MGGLCCSPSREWGAGVLWGWRTGGLQRGLQAEGCGVA